MFIWDKDVVLKLKSFNFKNKTNKKKKRFLALDIVPILLLMSHVFVLFCSV